MMRSVQFALCALLIATPMVAGEDQGTCLDALRKMFPDSGSALNSAAKWLEDNYGAATADDLKGVSGYAVDAMSLANSDASLDADTKKVLKLFFGNQVDVKPEQDRDATIMDVLKKDFPSVDVNVLQTVAKFLEDNFGASTAEDLVGVSDWAVNGLSLAKSDKNMGADAKVVLQLVFQTQSQRRLDMHPSSSMSSSMMASSSTTTTTTMAATTTTTMAATTTTTMDGTTTTMAGMTTTTVKPMFDCALYVDLCGGTQYYVAYTDCAGTAAANAMSCRITHLNLAKTDGAAVHCPHASPSGGGVCTEQLTAPKTTTTTTMMATTTTVTQASGGGDSGGGNTDPKDTTTTTTMAPVVTTTTMVAATVAFNAKFSVEVTDTAAFLGDMVNAKKVMADAVAAGNAEVTSAEMVTINSITLVQGTRRLGERRLAGNSLEVDYTVNFPSGYKGAGITDANTDWSKMTESIKNNPHGVAATVASGGFKWTKAPTCSGGGCAPTTTAMMTTTEGAEVTGGAVSAKQLATSVAAVLLVKLLSGM